MGDDWLGRRLRIALYRAFGAGIARGVSVHGGSYVSDLRNLRIRSGTFINRNCYLDLLAPLVLGERVTIGHGVTFVTTRHRSMFDGPDAKDEGHSIHVEDDAWIGANATILPGVTIGAGAVVGAAALVNRDVQPGWLVAGVPARPVRRIVR